MFLVTPEFTIRIADIFKLVPRTGLNKEDYGHTSGTLIYLTNPVHNRVDKEFTSLAYGEVLSMIATQSQ